MAERLSRSLTPMLGVDWWPVPTKDFRKLVPKALNGDYRTAG